MKVTKSLLPPPMTRKTNTGHVYPAISIKLTITVTLYDNLFKRYSRPGTSTMTLMALRGYDFWKKFEKDSMAGRKAAYDWILKNR